MVWSCEKNTENKDTEMGIIMKNLREGTYGVVQKKET
jgi:hypothetical protein